MSTSPEANRQEVDILARDESTPDLLQFERGLAGWISRVGLPEMYLFAPVRERSVLLANAEQTLAEVDSATKAKSFYITKMMAAASAGLFDAALNYLWNAVIDELRAMVANYDLTYFFDNAETNPENRKNLRGPGDLANLTDDCLLRTCEKIGLLSPVGYHRLDNIRFMRNNASAAHPNQEQLKGLELASYLEGCLETVMAHPQESFVGDVRRLLGRVRDTALDDQAIQRAGLFFKNLPGEKANALADGLLGQFTDSNRKEIQADNIRQLWPLVWPYVSEDARSKYGVRHAQHAAIAGSHEANAIKELLDLVDGGSSYLSETIRTAELADAVEELMRAHRGWDNFYNEVLPARRLRDLVGKNSKLPAPVRPQVVAAVTECFLGNGSGVSSGALRFYEELIAEFTPEEAGMALRIFLDQGVASVLRRPSGREQWSKLLPLIQRKFIGRKDQQLYDLVVASGASPDKLGLDTTVRKAAERQPS